MRSSMCCDVYVRLPDVDRPTVERFLDSRVADWRDDDAWSGDEPSGLLREGLTGAANGAAFYTSSDARLVEPLQWVIVAFPTDGGVVLGVSLEAEDIPGATVAPTNAPAVLDALREETGAVAGFYGVECAPPMTTAEWDEVVAWVNRSSA